MVDMRGFQMKTLGLLPIVCLDNRVGIDAA